MLRKRRETTDYTDGGKVRKGEGAEINRDRDRDRKEERRN